MVSRQHATQEAQLLTEIFAGFVEAMEPVIRDHLSRGIGHHGAIAEVFNRRGIPCWGRPRWHATDIRMVLSHGDARRAAGRAPCPSHAHGLADHDDQQTRIAQQPAGDPPHVRDGHGIDLLRRSR